MLKRSRTSHAFVVGGPRRQGGLSLIELMVSLTIGMVVVLAMSFLVIRTNQSSAELERSSRQLENGRYAIGLLSEEAALAGFWGEFQPCSGSIANVVIPADAAAACSTTTSGWNTAVSPVRPPVGIQGFKATGPACAAGWQAGTDILVVRRVSSETTTIAQAAASPEDWFLQTSHCSGDTVGQVVAKGSGGAAAFPLKESTLAQKCSIPPAASDPPNNALRRSMTRMYYVTGGASPQLVRAEILGGEWVVTPVVDGIENLQVQYDVDTTGDGIPDQIGLEAGAVASTCAAANAVCWANVVGITVHLLSRNTEATPGYTDGKTYVLGNTTVGPLGDGFKRHVYSSKVRIGNVAGRRENGACFPG